MSIWFNFDDTKSCGQTTIIMGNSKDVAFIFNIIILNSLSCLVQNSYIAKEFKCLS